MFSYGTALLIEKIFAPLYSETCKIQALRELKAK
jgi:hypothetical protein